MEPLSHWTPLDNAGKLFPSIETDRYTSYFRISATFREPVKPGVLQDALEAVLPRFPYFRVKASPGMFWYTLVEEASIPRIWPDSPYPCMLFKKNLQPPHLFRIRHYHRRLAVEFSHALTDGTGALAFLKALVAEYAHQRGWKREEGAGLIFPESSLDPRESEDAFLPLYQKGYPRPHPRDRAFRFPYKLSPKGVYHITTGLMPLGPLKTEAKALGLSLTEYLLAVLVYSLQCVLYSFPRRRRKALAKPFRIQVPVNLRRIFPSPTLRNFFLPVSVEFDPRLGIYTLEELGRKVHHLFQAQVDEKLIRKQIVRNVRGEVHPLSRAMPLFFKNWFLKGAFRKAEGSQTMSLSNLGSVDLPPGLETWLERFDFIPPPSPYNLVNASVVSFRDQMSLSFGRQAEDSRLEYFFFTTLRKRGIPVRLETN